MYKMVDYINFTKLIAFFIAFNRLFPLPLIMVHYTVINSWIAEKSCDETNMSEFFGYWVVMMVISFIWGFVIHYPIHIEDRTRKIAFCLWSGILSMLLFMSWSFIRAKPFKCVDNGNNLVYIITPIVFWITHISSLISTGFFISRYHMKNLQTFIRFGDYENNNDITI